MERERLIYPIEIAFRLLRIFRVVLSQNDETNEEVTTRCATGLGIVSTLRHSPRAQLAHTRNRIRRRYPKFENPHSHHPLLYPSPKNLVTAMPLPASIHPPTASDQDCAICHEPLVVPSSNNGEPSYLIDDVEFRCKHRFHWACILEYAVSSPEDARTRCALCRQSLLYSQGEFMVLVRNEEGVVCGFDFGHEIERHLFYKVSFPCVALHSSLGSCHGISK